MPSNPDSPYAQPGLPTSHVELARLLLNINKTRIADLPDLTVFQNFARLRPWYEEKNKLHDYILAQVKFFCLDINNPEPSLVSMRDKGWLGGDDLELARKQIESLKNDPSIEEVQRLSHGCTTQAIGGGGPTLDINIIK
jgi:hypothetical protein